MVTRGDMAQVCWVRRFNVAHENCGRLTGGTLVYKRGKWATGKRKFAGTI